MPVGERTAAVLVRRRSQIPLLAEALQADGLPVEVVGLGGLLTTPEVVDVVATLRVLVRHDTGTALARLLTGARWRIGASDLAALRQARAPAGPSAAERRRTRPPPASRSAWSRRSTTSAPADGYSAEGYRRLAQLSEELRRLRRRISAPLPELVADVERTIGIDIEVAARPDRAHIGRVHLDRFLDVAADFATEADEATLTAFLAFLEAAEDEENGLDAGEIVVDTERVQVLTVHGAKGLEWDVVAVPGLVDRRVPGRGRSRSTGRAPGTSCPARCAATATTCPRSTSAGATDRKEVRDRLVAPPRGAGRTARRGGAAAGLRRADPGASRCCSPRATSGTPPQKPRDAVAVPARRAARSRTEHEWAEPEPDETNPLTAEARTSMWPLDPLGPYPGDRGAGPARRRRGRRRAGARGRRRRCRSASASGPSSGAPTSTGCWPSARGWPAAATVEVELPRHLSVSQLVELDRDPDELARSIRRPLPRRPAPWARRGTAFHTWLEQRWQAQTLLDLDELPGAADETADDADFDALRDGVPRQRVGQPHADRGRGAVRDGRWPATGSSAAGWTPCSATPTRAGSSSTGRPAAGRPAPMRDAAAVQLAAYRLAWARLCGIPDDEVHRVRAAFHYVRTQRDRRADARCSTPPDFVRLLNSRECRVAVRGLTTV